MDFKSVATAVSDFNGVSFANVVMITKPTLNKFTGRPYNAENANPHHGRITCRSVKNCMISTTPAAFENWVNKRLAKEGATDKEGNQIVFKSGELAGNQVWMKGNEGLFIIGTPKNTGVETTYLRLYVMNTISTEYFLDGKTIEKSDIIGLPVKKFSENGQAGIKKENRSNIQSPKIESLVSIDRNGHHE